MRCIWAAQAAFMLGVILETSGRLNRARVWTEVQHVRPGAGQVGSGPFLGEVLLPPNVEKFYPLTGEW